ncbi:right-handed parallel beta-helix repeat-containing protein [Vannielia sp. SX4]|uniref:right-handed parallel beta-helix repeat-containing protein n=1 Tax=Vannielia sp. SX4 TaxID=3463852 RepID=UPI0040583E66
MTKTQIGKLHGLSPHSTILTLLLCAACRGDGTEASEVDATPETLMTALMTASGGDTIVLSDGTYSNITLSRDYSSELTIVAENPLGAVVENLSIPGGSNIRIEGLQVDNMPRVDGGAHHITYVDNLFTNGVYFIDASHVALDGNEIIGNVNGVILNSVSHFELTDNLIRDAVSDLLRITGDSHHGLIENNKLHDVHAVRPHHPDLIQMFSYNGATPHDITIRGNHLYDDPDTGDVYGQGIFLSDPSGSGYYNILIEQNIINVGSPNSIYINGGQSNVVIQDNSLIPWPGAGGAMIILAAKSGMSNAGTTVKGNAVRVIDNQTGAATVGDNYVYGRDADLTTLFSGDGDDWQDFIPVEGSPIDFGSGYGAETRLAEMAGHGGKEN